MRKGLWLVASLLVVTIFLVVGCSGHPKGMENPRELTDAEKAKVVEIALNTPEALEWLERESKYSTRLAWAAIVWKNSGYSEWHSLDYEVVYSGIPADVSKKSNFYPEVIIYFGEPPQWVLQFSIDIGTEKVVHSTGGPIR